jgi:hypothetical protein
MDETYNTHGSNEKFMEKLIDKSVRSAGITKRRREDTVRVNLRKQNSMMWTIFFCVFQHRAQKLLGTAEHPC